MPPLPSHDEKARTVHRIFASIAKRYDFINSFLSCRIDRRWRRNAVKLSGLAPGDSVLDVCCGTGELAFEYRRAIGLKDEVIGTDFCQPMIDVAIKKLNTRSLEGVKLLKADTLNLPFKSNSFDVVSVGFGIRNVAGLEEGLREMIRVAKPGGRVVILDFTQPPNGLFRFIYFFYFQKILPLVGKLFSGDKTKAYSYLPDSVMAFPDSPALSDLMKHSGLLDVRFTYQTFGIAAIHVGIKS
jgi:demethylmenaquinone methyltransferase / 2-methoxy-6-polyprenyl-1,4-benzoquinol methylase